LGKAFLAGLSDTEIRMLYSNVRKLERRTSHTQTKIPQILAEIAAVRREGIAYDNEEYMPGLRCIAAPIKDFSSRTIAAMSLSMFKHKMTSERRASFKAALFRASYALSEKMGYPAPRKIAI
jgi:DNA-binding IclR family transcriptional regulator